MATRSTSAAGSPVRLRGHDVPTDCLVAGDWRRPAARFSVFNPSTGAVLAEIGDGDAGLALEALDAAVTAQEAWRQVAPRARADLLHRAHRLLEDRRDRFVETMVLESGKPLGEAHGEFTLSAGFLLWYAEQAAHVHGTFAPGSPGGYRIVTTYHPVGPSLLVTPWNFPLLMPVRKAGAALAAGCTVVMKSAKETPLSAALFVEVLLDAGVPAGVVNLVHTTASAAVSEALMQDERLRKISFTGSTAAGTTLLRQAADHIMSASMELGGDGPFVVLDDADVDLAVREAVSCKFRNAGQACVAANRIVLQSGIADEFTSKFVEASRSLSVGDGFDPGVEVGPIITESQRRRVADLVDAFLDSGAEILAGGKALPGDGYFFEPTVLRVRTQTRSLCNTELFAPIAALYTVDSVAEAINFANDTSYGLAAYLFTRDLSRAIAVAERLEFGMVGVNRGIMADPAAAFGGVKASGLGREGGHDGIDEFLEPQYLALTVDETAADRR